jgi:hypothetical protein
MFLYRPDQEPDQEPSVPQYGTAIGASGLGRNGRDVGRYVFAEVEPNQWRLWGLLDVDQSFRADVDVLAQPTAGDWVGTPIDLTVQPGRTLSHNYEVAQLISATPPAFLVENASGEVLELETRALTTLTLTATSVGPIDAATSGFVLRLTDDDGDGLPDDATEDGVPDVSLRAFLRWLPRPSETSEEDEVIVPLLFDPGSLVSRLSSGRLTAVSVSALTCLVVPQAQRVSRRGGVREVQVVGTPPLGEYELVVLADQGQFWRIPNAMGRTNPSQAVRFRFGRGP